MFARLLAAARRLVCRTRVLRACVRVRRGARKLARRALWGATYGAALTWWTAGGMLAVVTAAFAAVCWLLSDE